MADRPQKITFAQMRNSGVRGLLIYCSDYKCSNLITLSGDHLFDESTEFGSCKWLAEKRFVLERFRYAATFVCTDEKIWETPLLDDFGNRSNALTIEVYIQ